MSGKDTTTKTVNAPWTGAEPYYKTLYEKAQSAFDATNNNPYTGETYAGPTQTQQDALAGIKTAAGGMGTGVDALRQLAESQLRGDWLNPNSNPYISQVANAALLPVQQSFDKNRLAVEDRGIATGAYGGSRQDIQQNQLVDDFNRAAGDITSGIYNSNYQNERAIQQNTPQLLNAANLLALAGPTALMGAGATEQGWNQGALDAALQKYQMGQEAPWAGISELANVLSSGGFGSQSTTTPAPSVFSQILKGALGGATTGAGLATGIGGVAAGAGLSAFAPWMLPFAALGGLAGGLG